MAPGEAAAEWESFGEVAPSSAARTFTRPLPPGEENREAIRRLNTSIPEEAWGINFGEICYPLTQMALTLTKHVLGRLFRARGGVFPVTQSAALGCLGMPRWGERV